MLQLQNSLNVCKFPWMRVKFQEWIQFPGTQEIFSWIPMTFGFLRENFLGKIPVTCAIRLEKLRNSWNSWEIPGMRAKFLERVRNSFACEIPGLFRKFHGRYITPHPHARTFACKWQTIHFRYRTNPRFLYTNNIAVSLAHFQRFILKSILYCATTKHILYLVSNRIWVHNKLLMRKYKKVI